MRIFSCRLLKMFCTGKNPAVVLLASSGSLAKMSLMYCAEIGLIKFEGIWVTGAEPAGQPPVTAVMQTGWVNAPVSIPVVGTAGFRVVYVWMRRASSEKKKNVLYLSLCRLMNGTGPPKVPPKLFQRSAGTLAAPLIRLTLLALLAQLLAASLSLRRNSYRLP